MQSREDEALARAAVDALTGQLALAPKPGLPDPRDLAARTTRRGPRRPALVGQGADTRPRGDGGRRPPRGEPLPCSARNSARSAAAPSTRSALAGGGHRGALWALGLLVAAAALDPGAGAKDVAATAKRIAAHPDRRAPRAPRAVRRSRRSTARPAPGARPRPDSRTYGGRWTPSPRPARRAPPRPGPPGRPAHRDVHPPGHRTPAHRGPVGPAARPGGGPRVLEAGGTSTEAGAEALAALDTDLHARAWSPRGSAGLLAGALFLDSLPVNSLAWAA
jgi:triphosphoribosyl-dephospho-CoA synthase